MLPASGVQMLAGSVGHSCGLLDVDRAWPAVGAAVNGDSQDMVRVGVALSDLGLPHVWAVRLPVEEVISIGLQCLEKGPLRREARSCPVCQLPSRFTAYSQYEMPFRFISATKRIPIFSATRLDA